MTSTNFTRSGSEVALSDPVSGLYPFPNRTLADLRQSLVIRLGFAAQLAALPSGMAELLTDILQDCQRQLWHRYPILRLERWFTWATTAGTAKYDPLGNDEAKSTLLSAPSNVIVTSEVVAGPQTAASAYWYQVSSVNAYGETIPSAQKQGFGTVYNGLVEILWNAVPGATKYRIYGRTLGSSLFIAEVAAPTTAYVDNLSITPSGVPPTVNTTASGPAAALLNPLSVRWAGIKDSRGTWYPMARGIPPLLYTTTNQGMPYRYEIDQYLELYPTPNAVYTVEIRGEIGLQAFAADTDTCTINHHPLFLMALATAKEHYGQNASSQWRELEVLIGQMVKGAHAGRRYIPNPQGNHAYPDDFQLPQPRATFR